MTTGNGMPATTQNGEDSHARDGSRQLRHIEELVARLRVVTKQLELPPRSMPAPRHPEEHPHAHPATPGEAGNPASEAVRQAMNSVSWG
jgi:hypothetical protein